MDKGLTSSKIWIVTWCFIEILAVCSSFGILEVVPPALAENRCFPSVSQDKLLLQLLRIIKGVIRRD